MYIYIYIYIGHRYSIPWVWNNYSIPEPVEAPSEHVWRGGGVRLVFSSLTAFFFLALVFLPL